VTARLSDAALCAQIEEDAMDRWGGADVLDLVSRCRHAAMRAKLRAVVEKHRPRWSAVPAIEISIDDGFAVMCELMQDVLGGLTTLHFHRS